MPPNSLNRSAIRFMIFWSALASPDGKKRYQRASHNCVRIGTIQNARLLQPEELGSNRLREAPPPHLRRQKPLPKRQSRCSGNTRVDASREDCWWLTITTE